MAAHRQALLDLSGQTFGRLIVVGRATPRGVAPVKWRCRCACGNEIVAISQNIRRGDTSSCGCLRTELTRRRSTTHGHASGGESPEFRAWMRMRNRCGNPKDKAFANYGGRGIRVCDRWRDSFPNFLADMGPRPSPAHSLDRIDVNGDYEPGNCRWATWDEQQNNKRKTVRVALDGETMSLRQAATRLGLRYKSLWQRVRKDGQSFTQAVAEMKARA